MAKVLKAFKCKVTKRVYEAGEQYDEDRLEELQELGYVESEDDGNWPKHTGGGYFELSNGEKVRGQDAAIAAQAEIDKATSAD